MNALIPCPRCGAHVHGGESCPFCTRRGRVAIIAGVLGLSLAACTPGVESANANPVAQGQPDARMPAPKRDAGPPSASPQSAALETTPAPVYGGPGMVNPPEPKPEEPKAPEPEGKTP